VPRHNGGDGFVAARHLPASGWPIRLFLLGAREGLRGDAARHAARWNGAGRDIDAGRFPARRRSWSMRCSAPVSARPIDGLAHDVIALLPARRLTVIAVDVPSGSTGRAARCALRTVLRPHGHLLPQKPAICSSGARPVRRDDRRRYRHPGRRSRHHPPAYVRERAGTSGFEGFPWPAPTGTNTAAVTPSSPAAR